MMRLWYTQPNYPVRLLSDLTEKVPALSPVTKSGNKIAVFCLVTNGDDITIDVDDAVVSAYPGGAAQLKADVGKVVSATDPTPPPPPPDPDDELAASIQAATTLDELKAALVGQGRPAAVRGRRK